MPNPRMISCGQAICEALDQAMSDDPRVFLMGEGAADPKGIFGTTAGLVDKYGPQRVMEMPLAENGFSGIGIGAALMGQRPVMVHQRVEFCLLALEQLFNNAAKMHYVSGGKHKVPIVVRLIVGRGWGQGPAHSQSLETLFSYIPGLKVVMPTNAYDAKSMLLGAIEDDNPVIFLEHRWIHYALGDVPERVEPSKLTGPKIMREGSDVTLVATSYMVFEALQAADELAKVGINAEVIDLRVLRPLNVAPIEASVRKTGHLVFVDTGFTTLGLGAEVNSRITESCFGVLKSAPKRIGLPEHPTPSSRSLAEVFYPHSGTIAKTIAEMLGAAPDKLASVLAALKAKREDLPFDIPHPSFKGPF